MENGKKILVVEDDVPTRTALCDKLTHEGFVVLEARNGEEGLSTALSQHPDLILLDLIMPVMDGMTMFKQLRESDEWGEKALVIILTNLSGEEDKIINSVATLAPSYYLVKADWRLDSLMTRIKEVLGINAIAES